MKKLATLILIFISITSFAQTIESEVIKLINQLRLEMGGAEQNLNPFVRNSALDSAAQYHARWIVASGIGGHIETKSLPGIVALSKPDHRAAKYGVTLYAENVIQYSWYIKTGKKIDVKATANDVFALWKNSPVHLENMLFAVSKPVEPRIGIAVVPYDENDFCIVMVVGANIDRNGKLTK